MNTKPLSSTSQKILVYLYVTKTQQSVTLLMIAVQDTNKNVKDSLDTLTKHELIIRVKRNCYVIHPDIVIKSELDGAVIGLSDTNLYGNLYGIDTNLYGNLYGIRRLSIDIYMLTTKLLTVNNLTVNNLTVNNLTVKASVQSDMSKDRVISTPASIVSDTDTVVTNSGILPGVMVCNVGGVGGAQLDAYLQTERKTTDWTGLMDVPAFFSDLLGVPLPDDNDTTSKFKALCPFHSERTPSFNYNITDGWWKCYGCGVEGYGMFDLLDKLGYDGQELLDYAYTYSLDVLGDDERRAKAVVREQSKHERASVNKRTYDNEMVMVRDWYAHGFGGANVVDDWIHGVETPERDYLFARGILPDALQHFKVAVFLNLRDHRIYFPLALNGVVYGYQLRTIRDSTENHKVTKYLTMPGMDKSLHVYGGTLPREQQVALIVEGVSDMLVAWQRGLAATATTLGAIVSVEQATELANLGITRVIHAAHPDFAGDSAFALGRVTFASVGIESVRLHLSTDIADSRRDDFLAAYANALTSFTNI